MARIRQARRCAATRSGGTPCRGWAMAGQTVCHAHGGTSPQALLAARQRLRVADIERAYRASHAAYMARWRAWQSARITEAAALMGLDPMGFITPLGVNEALIVCCRIEHGRPASIETAPRFRWDRRYRGSRPEVDR